MLILKISIIISITSIIIEPIRLKNASELIIGDVKHKIKHSCLFELNESNDKICPKSLNRRIKSESIKAQSDWTQTDWYKDNCNYGCCRLGPDKPSFNKFILLKGLRSYFGRRIRYFIN